MKGADTTLVFTGRRKELQMLHDFRALAEKNHGQIVCITGETGCGKSALLHEFTRSLDASTFLVATSACQAPIGTLSVGEIQPLYPFRRIFEAISESQEKKVGAKKRFMINLGMSALGIIPIVGEIVSAVKEIRRDIREYEQDKQGEEQGKHREKELINGYVSALAKISTEQKLVLIFDNFQWADAQSVELLAHISRAISTLPILMLVAYREHEAKSAGHPLVAVVNAGIMQKNIAAKIELPAFSGDEMRELCRANLPTFAHNADLEKWLMTHSSGMPNVAVEYIRYFAEHSPFDANGKFSEQLQNGEFVPATVGALFATTLDQLSEEDKSLLELCSVEGSECTVFMISRLLNTDVLTTVRKLRSLQKRTGIIRSIGAQTRYGAKTTVYEFSQAMYHHYFLQLLEYEEKNAIHSQIVAILDQEFQQTESKEKRALIAPYLAGHSGEAGDTETLREMLKQSAENASRFKTQAVLENVYKSFSHQFPEENTRQKQEILRLLNHEREVQLGESSTTETMDFLVELGVENFPAVRGAVIRHLTNERFQPARTLAERYLLSTGKELPKEQQVELQTLLLRCLTELGDFKAAEKIGIKVREETEILLNPAWKCLVLNALAMLRLRQYQPEAAHILLSEAGEIALTLANEYQVITTANIAAYFDQENPEEALRYREAALLLAQELNPSAFEALGIAL